MNQEVLCFKEIVNQLKLVPDIQWDPNTEPVLPFDPYNEDKDFLSHYFLLVASIDEGNVIGKAINARIIIYALYKELGSDLFNVFKNLDQIYNILCEIRVNYGLRLGRLWKYIPEILNSVNTFVMQRHGKLYKWSLNYKKPIYIVNEISNRIKRMGKTPNSTRKKAWMYMRWMVRPYPDLHVYDHLKPMDLYLPLDRNAARTYKKLGVLKSTNNLSWNDVAKVTKWARALYSSDPAIVDYPAFIVGRLLSRYYGISICEILSRIKGRGFDNAV